MTYIPTEKQLILNREMTYTCIPKENNINNREMTFILTENHINNREMTYEPTEKQYKQKRNDQYTHGINNRENAYLPTEKQYENNRRKTLIQQMPTILFQNRTFLKMAATKTGTFLKTLTSNAIKSRVVSTTTTRNQNVSTLTLNEAPAAACPFRNAFQNVDKIFKKEGNPAPMNTENKTMLKKFDEIPGPKGLPLVGTLFDYFKKDGLSFDKMFEAYQKRAIEFGPIYKESIATINTVVISDPAEYSKVMRAEGKYPQRREMEPMAHYRRQNGIDLGLVNDQGENWHRLRTVTAPKMLKMKEALDFCGAMNEVGNDFMKHLTNVRESNNEVQGLEEEIFKWAFESIGTFLFEERIGCFDETANPKAQEFIDHLREYFRCHQPLMYNLPVYKLYKTKLWKKFEHHADNVFKLGKYFVDKKVAELEAAKTTDCVSADKPQKAAFLTYMLSQQSLAPEEALSTAVDLLKAATETTSNAMLWTMYCLAKNPEIQDKLYNETQTVLGENGEITAENISKLTYVKAVLKEAFRKYPITWATSRITTDDIEVCGYKIPAGTHVQANLFGMFRDENLFPDNDSFSPERWLRESKMDPKLKSLSNLIWGHGARMCIGRRFAEQEMHILLTKITQNFRLEYDHEDIEPTLNTVMTPDRPVVLKFIPRSNS